MSKISQEIEPAIGQVWADNDPRSSGREIVIRNIFEVNGEKYALCDSGVRETRIKLTRFKPTKTGYRFVRSTL